MTLFLASMAVLAALCMGIAGLAIWAFNRLADAVIADRPAE